MISWDDSLPLQPGLFEVQDVVQSKAGLVESFHRGTDDLSQLRLAKRILFISVHQWLDNLMAY
jgi:hypothetical protein